ncbi:Clp protease N-terminal domain-containing protein [Streptomyces griseus]|uniref:Clp protease N-terminal domain-containing protein n=1 Tax=Streptomyces griseus TaxID=1911 RepID=UPI000840480F|nr:Clp protease N-terminal domain-containing protein [Streptomyces griseus]
MHNRTAGISEQTSPTPPGTGFGLTAEMTAVATGARRRAVRGGDRHIDTAHLLHSLIEADPAVRETFDGGPQLARVLGYLVQRSIGYGLRWQGKQEDSGTFRAVRGAGTAGWSPSAAAAVGRAARSAALRGDAHAGGLDLLSALVADPRCRAVEVLEQAGVDAARLAERATGRQAGAGSRT